MTNRLSKEELLFESRGETPTPGVNTLVLMVTGHRPNVLDNAYELTHPTAIKIGCELRNKIKEIGGYSPETDTFRYAHIHLISGMALGVDTYFYAVGLALRDLYPDVFTVECAIPHQHHGNHWIRKSQLDLLNYVEKADAVTLVSSEDYSPKAMQDRNEYMVDKASQCIAVWNGNRGGTGNCVRYIRSQKKTMYHLDPNTYQWQTHLRGESLA